MRNSNSELEEDIDLEHEDEELNEQETRNLIEEVSRSTGLGNEEIKSVLHELLNRTSQRKTLSSRNNILALIQRLIDQRNIAHQSEKPPIQGDPFTLNIELSTKAGENKQAELLFQSKNKDSKESLYDELLQIFNELLKTGDQALRNKFFELMSGRNTQVSIVDLIKHNKNHSARNKGMVCLALLNNNLDIAGEILQEMLRSKDAESQNLLHEELYWSFIEILSSRDGDSRRDLLLGMRSQIDKLKISFEDIDKYVASNHPGYKSLGYYFAIHLEPNKKELKPSNAANFARQRGRPLSIHDLFFTITKGRDPEIIEAIDNAIGGKLLSARDHNQSNPLSYFALLENYMDYKEILKRHVGDDEEIEEFIKVSRARFVVGLSYSTDQFAGLYGYGYERLMSLTLGDNKKLQEKETIKKSLQCIESKEAINLPNNPIFSKIQVTKIPYVGHAAYLIVKYDKQNKPVKISYIDGNLIHDKTHAEITFDIDPAKLKTILGKHQTLENFIQTDFNVDYRNNTRSGLRKQFNDRISSLVTCDKDKNPIISEKAIPSKAQNRGNCAYKSMNIALRAVMKEIDPTLTFERDKNGKNSGKGYEAYQQYKKGATEESLDTLLECAKKEGFRDKKYYDQTIDILKPAFLQAVRKGNFERLDEIVDIFDKQDINISDIKSEKDGSNALFFAVKKQNVEMINWCYDHDIKIEKNSKDQYPYEFAETKEVAQTLLSKESERIDPKKHQEINESIDKIFTPKTPAPSIEKLRESNTLLTQESQHGSQKVY